MTALTRLQVTALRNIDSLSLQPALGINLLYGENGSGKTSILESIYLLGMARSFRSHQMRPLIQAGKDEATVFGELDNGLTLGVTKSGSNAQHIRIGGRNALNAAELAHAFPLQLLNSDTFGILEGGPGTRRRLLDWGVFHVEHDFLDSWRRVQRALQNRNRLLKAHASEQELEPWSRELARNGERLHLARLRYLDQLLPVVSGVLSDLIDLTELNLTYDKGWESASEDAESLLDVLRKDRDRDYRVGHTNSGPHRADIRIRIGSRQAVEILSRGQQKLLVGALKLAQGIHLEQETGRRCVYLVDDLPAELDRNNRTQLCRVLERLKCQVFITSVEQEALAGALGATATRGMFHVKHGKISARTE